MLRPNQARGIEKMVGAALATALATIAVAGFAGKAKANDGGYPWADATELNSSTYDWGYPLPCRPEIVAAGKCGTIPYTLNGVRYEESDSYGFNLRNCTSYVAWRADTSLGIKVPATLGDGGMWDNNAPAQGYKVTSIPESGDVAQWDSINHVAFVDSVNTDGSVNVSEYNYIYPGSFDQRGEAYNGTKVIADHYIDLNGVGVGLGGSQPERTTNVVDRPLGVAGHPSGEQNVFWRDSQGSLREAWWGGNSDPHWHGPIYVNGGMGPLGSAPTAIVRPDNDHQNVYWKGKDNNIWQAYYDGNWHGPYPINVGGNAASQPTAAAWGSEVDVFYKGVNGDLMEIWQPAASMPWNGPVDLGMGTLGSAPAAVAHPSGEQDVFWRGMDGELWEAFYVPGENNGNWYGPLHLAMGRIGTAPTAVWVPAKNEEDVFWMGMDGNIWQTKWSGNWANPIFVGMGTLGSAPSAAAWGGETDIFWRGMSPNTNFWEAWGQTGAWNGPASPGIGPIPTTYP